MDGRRLTFVRSVFIVCLGLTWQGHITTHDIHKGRALVVREHAHQPLINAVEQYDYFNAAFFKISKCGLRLAVS